MGRIVAMVVLGMMLVAGERGVAAITPGQSERHALLDVPYMSQTAELCGGAAVAMVLRYWGQRDVFPQDFAPLISAGDGGILTGVLTSAVRGRGWQALVMPIGEPDPVRTRIRSELDRGRPLIALIEVAPRTYHYVVIVGSTDQDVVLHDPARAPFRVLRWDAFDRAWTPAGRWMLLVLPSTGGRLAQAPAPPDLPSSDADDDTPCRALVRRGVSLAVTGDAESAEQGLVAATGLCPDDPASWRELAGLRFSQARWAEAAHLASSAIHLAPDDAYAWQLVATSRYLTGDVMGALDAWNHVGEPRTDTISVHGAERTHHPVVVHAAGLQPRQLLTPAAFGRAVRRVRDLPVASNARMTFEPGATKQDGGVARVDVSIDERNVAPRGWLALASLGARAALSNEVRVDVAGPLGAGELTSASWRWAHGRPRVTFGLAIPSFHWLHGVVSFDASWERQSYDLTPSSAAAAAHEERRQVGLHLSDWSSGWLRWKTGAGLDRLRQHDDLQQTRVEVRDYLTVDGALDIRLFSDRLAFGAAGNLWTPFAGGQRFTTGELLAAWRSTDQATQPSWSAIAEIMAASRVAPLALWQGAGTGQGRRALLRAHPLLNDGVLTGQVFGRDVAHGSFEYAHPVRRTPAGGLSIVGFVDAARAWHRLNSADPSRLYVDAGLGVRIRAPGPGAAVRIDAARGLRGGGTTLSANWGVSWPR